MKKEVRLYLKKKTCYLTEQLQDNDIMKNNTLEIITDSVRK